MQHVHLYSDGACSGNPGPGGWGCILVHNKNERHLSGFEEHTTNNRMEMMAIVKGLESLQRGCKLTIVTDSQYVKNAFTEGWLEKWQRNDWKTANRDPVKNKDLWLQLLLLCSKHQVSWKWVKGHSGHIYNEQCDELARAAIVRKNGIDKRISLEPHVE